MIWEPRCERCRYWHRQEENERPSQNWGECRRYPPTLVNVSGSPLVMHPVRPMVSCGDYCGEWEATSPDVMRLV